MQWLSLQLTKIVTWILTKLGFGMAVPEDEQKKCPDCGEDWDGEEIFCYYCGYEECDHENPLHPPPVRDDAVVDPDGLVDENTITAISERISAVSKNKNIDLAVLVLPKDLRKALESQMDSADGVVDITRSMEGLSFTIYNDWLMGKETDMKGCLVVLDPEGEERVLVQGRNGPGIKGADFRNWFDGFEITAEADEKAAISKELEIIAGGFETI